MRNWDCPKGIVPFPSSLVPTTSMVCEPSERALMRKGGMPGSVQERQEAWGWGH